MTNSSCLSKATMMAIAAAIAAVVAVAVDVAMGSFSPVSAVIMLVSAGLAGSVVVGTRKAATAIARMTAVCKDIDKGNFEARLVDVSETGDVGELMHSINDMVDRTDAYVRDSAASLEYVARNQYFRRIPEKGMMGSFLNASRGSTTPPGPSKRRSGPAR